MRIIVNGSQREIAEETELPTLLGELGLPPSGVIVVHNHQVVPAHETGKTVLSDGDTLELVRFVAGG